MPKTVKLYIHIPFCGSKCAYCDFYSLRRPEWMAPYVDAVLAEWQARSGDRIPDTLYLGGGTPSILPIPLLEKLIDGLGIHTPLREATIEANPDDVTDDWARFITSQTPLRRVSLGVQSLIDSELSAVGRRHTAAKAIEAVGTLRRHGITDISCDLIYGLPGQTIGSWRESLTAMTTLRPEHLSAYLLSYEPGTRLYAMLSIGKIREADEDTVRAMYDVLCDAAAQAGYEHYEISNFALPGHRAVHNSGYWDLSDYIGLGPGAHSYEDGVRSCNPPDLKAYISAGGLGGPVAEPETDDNRFNDLLIIRLRTASGVGLQEIESRFGQEFARDFMRDAAPMLADGRLQMRGGTVTIPERGWLTADAVLRGLIRV